jgi:chromate transporter
MKNKLIRLALAFLKLGFTAFGGPATSYAMMREEFVLRKKWLSEEEFFEYLGIANLVPGPNATELAMLIGYHSAGVWGFVVAGVCLVFPAMLTVLGFAWSYVQFGTLPVLDGVLYAIKPVVVAILLSALWGLIKPRVKQMVGMLVAVGVAVAYLLGVSPILLMLGGGLLMLLITLFNKTGDVPMLLLVGGMPGVLFNRLAERTAFSLSRLFWVFLKAGALMYGSGYVLLAFIHEDLVVQLQWLTESQLIDAVAVGQVTPGPLFTTATFVGYVLGGLPAALLATLGMFLPSMIIMVIMLIVYEKVRNSTTISKFLTGVNFAALGLMAGVTWEVARTAVIDSITGVIAAIALLLIVRFKVSAPWLILGGGVIGLIRMAFTG